MDKLKLHSPDLTDANIAKLAELFPHCVTELRDAGFSNDSLKINVEQLFRALSPGTEVRAI